MYSKCHEKHRLVLAENCLSALLDCRKTMPCHCLCTIIIGVKYRITDISCSMYFPKTSMEGRGGEGSGCGSRD